jgi:uncharacterized Zn-binding protein involved in type VI secretion
MGQPAAVMGDRVTGTCAAHQVPNPSSGAPQPAPPMPFSGPLLQGLASSILIGGKPAAVVGAAGMNTPPHVGLHPSDPFLAPTSQRGSVTSGSASVLFEGKPAARTGSLCTICAAAPGQLTGTAATVLIGG